MQPQKGSIQPIYQMASVYATLYSQDNISQQVDEAMKATVHSFLPNPCTKLCINTTAQSFNSQEHWSHNVGGGDQIVTCFSCILLDMNCSFLIT